MNPFYIIAAIILLGGLLAFRVYYTNSRDSLNSIPPTRTNYVQAVIGGNTFKLEIADTNEKRQKGLMEVANLPEDEGMFFVFESTGIYPFWMKNTLIPLDIIWLNDKYEVIYIKKDAQPCSNLLEAICETIIPISMAKYVIELNAGKAAELNLQNGDLVEIKYPE